MFTLHYITNSSLTTETPRLQTDISDNTAHTSAHVIHTCGIINTGCHSSETEKMG